MANQYNTDLTFLNLKEYVLRELKEPASVGSEAVPLNLVEDVLNDVYASAFNDRRMKQSARESDYSFALANDTTITSDLAVGAVTIPLSDSTTFRPSGKVLLQSDIATYTSNAANTLSGVTGIETAQVSGTVARQMYLLTDIAPTIQGEEIHYLDINGIPQAFMEYDRLLTEINFVPNSYSIYKGYLIFSKQATLASSVPSKVLMIVTENVIPMVATTDKPILIPNSWRVPILVYGACMKIAASDSFRTSWDWWKEQHEASLSQYIAFKNNRVKDIQNRRRPSVWGSNYMTRM